MTSTKVPGREVGRYVLFEEMASGGMATVHYGRLSGPAGFSRTVAIKKLHETFAKNPEFVSMFLDEARIAARVRHPNVVSILDVVSEESELLIVMEYVQGATLAQLLRATRQRGETLPHAVAVGVMVQTLLGLHAAHEARSEDGTFLSVVHRDVSPQNILVGADGIARVADFGIAKAAGRLQTTREGDIKGKASYMAPEQMRGQAVDRRADCYAAGVVLWESLTGERLFAGDSTLAIMNDVFEKVVPAVSAVCASVPTELDAIVARAIARDPKARFASAREMAVALETTTRVASAREISDWVGSVASDSLRAHASRITEIESGPNLMAENTPPGLPRPEVKELPTIANHERVATTARNAVRGRRIGIAVVAMTLLGGIVVASSWRGPRPPSQGGPGSSEPAPAKAAEAEALPMGTTTGASVSSAAVPSAASASSVAASTSAGVGVTEAPSVRPPSKSPRATTLASPVARPVTPRRTIDCNPPYTLDKTGARRWKDGC